MVVDHRNAMTMDEMTMAQSKILYSNITMVIADFQQKYF